MSLHDQKDLFVPLVKEIALATDIAEAIIEKDYFVTLFLKYLSEKEPLLVLKGGTCLSKCFKLIERFSEDIDINLQGVKNLTQSRKKQLKDHIFSVIDMLGLSLANPDKIKSGMDYNLYEVSYPAAFAGKGLKPHLEIESVFRIEAFPTTKMTVSSIIWEYAKGKVPDQMISELLPFEICVQTLERTFVDKIFAICDYYISGRIDTRSRHFYDLYKILPHVKLDGNLKTFVEEIRKVREGKHDCPSAESGVSLPDILNQIITKKAYKSDYVNITELLLYETVTYEQVIEAVRTIAEWLRN